ncbi:MAG: hydroxymethylbilane synthase [Arenicellales bacterium WSBS_2016_MAG_OTU3]
MKLIRIGTRHSRLALWQANYVADALKRHHAGLAVELVKITTQGDKTLGIPLATVGGKGLFLKELETALLAKEIDIAVHSIKDVTINFPDGLHLPVICERADPRDAFVSNTYSELAAMPAGSRVGTCSLRRKSILKNAFPDLEFIDLRGNVDTRLARLDAGDFDAIILASAGLKRLELHDRIKQNISEEVCLPAVGQGAVGIECRNQDQKTHELIMPLHHAATAQCVLAERAVNKALDGGCHVPVALHAIHQNGEIFLRGRVAAVDGSRVLTAQASGPKEHPETIASKVATDLLAQGAGDILAQAYAS